MRERQAIGVLALLALLNVGRDGDDPVWALSALRMRPSEHRMGDRELEVLVALLTKLTLMDPVQCSLHARIAALTKALSELLRVCATTGRR